MKTNTNNLVRTAVDTLGGATRVANRLGISSSTVHAWMKQGRIANYDHAETLAGWAKIPASVLRGDELSNEAYDLRLAQTKLRESIKDYVEQVYDYGRDDLDLIKLDEKSVPSRKAIKAGVISMVIGMDLGGGSGLYELVETFLRNPDARLELEKVVKAGHSDTLAIMSREDAEAGSTA
ncbi:MAG: hypothetical protein ABIR54_22755 [Burkholderiaceae bacterium]